MYGEPVHRLRVLLFQRLPIGELEQSPREVGAFVTFFSAVGMG